jgi:hypothetical protein
MSQAEAYRVSPQLLAREDFRNACAARDFGAVFHLIRKYDGASQDRICSPVDGLSQSRVSRIMRGDDRVATLDLIERIVDGLRIPGSYVGLVPRAWESDELAPALPATVTALRPRTATNGNTALDPAPSRTPVPQPVPRLPEAEPDQSAPPQAASHAYVPAQVGRPVGLRPHIERAFNQDVVTIDFAGFSGETLAGALGEPLDKIRHRELAPSSLHIRVLVPDTGRTWALPCRIEDQSDEPAFRERAAGILDRSLSTILDAVTELRDLDLVADATAEVRVHGLAPLFKLYLINNREAFFGFYPITEHTVRAGGGVHPMYDLMGKDSLLFHHCADDTDPTGKVTAAAQYVTQARLWFDSVWATVAKDYTPS